MSELTSASLPRTRDLIEMRKELRAQEWNAKYPNGQFFMAVTVETPYSPSRTVLCWKSGLQRWSEGAHGDSLQRCMRGCGAMILGRGVVGSVPRNRKFFTQPSIDGFLAKAQAAGFKDKELLVAFTKHVTGEEPLAYATHNDEHRLKCGNGRA